ncbi:cupin domain-containing protein [Coralliovum pocilloporae]|uniref:cupin domain-containing protein n=1 Tax=Coralliovum pocilloporae TaxID=3066369 RepID=UPI0033077E1C
MSNSRPDDDGNAVYLIKADEIAAMDGETKIHFLNANAQRINKSLGDLTGLTGFGFHLIEVEPGYDTTEYHLHHCEDECVYVLDGEATAFIGDEAFTISPGDFIGYRKGGLPHSIHNSGNTVLKCIVVGDRLPHDMGDYPKKAKRLYRNAGMGWDLVDHDAIKKPK